MTEMTKSAEPDQKGQQPSIQAEIKQIFYKNQ